MKKINRMITNICSSQLTASRNFYTKLFNLKVSFDSDWFVQLVSEDGQFELGIIQRDNEIVPKEFQNLPTGFYITFVVDNTDEICELAQSENFEIISPPEDTFYGQRRLLLKAPEGTLVDISSLIPNYQP